MHNDTYDIEGLSTNTNRDGISRRSVLKSTAFATGVMAFGVPISSAPARANSHTTETLYLTDTNVNENVSTRLFTVELDGSVNQAILELELELTDSNFRKVDALAASLDGETLYFVDKDSGHLGIYDVDSEVFTDEGVIAGLPDGVVLASFSPDGDLLVVSNDDNTVYGVDPSGPTATSVVTVGTDVSGADIAFDADETMFLYSNATGDLYEIDLSDGTATSLGSTGDLFTGLAVRDAGNGDLVGSNTTRDEIVVFDKTNGDTLAAYDMYFEGSPYPYGSGDMSVGALDVTTCLECDEEEFLAKYEFDCVETDEEDECVAWDFVFEKGDDTLVTYDEGSFVSKEGEDFEPTSATFGTEYCTVYAVVKAGKETEVQTLDAVDGEVTVENIGKYAISFVAFYCTEGAANDAEAAFPSKGKKN